MVTQLPIAVKYRGCPSCGYMMTQMEVERLRFDMPCPRCAGKLTSQFIPIAPSGMVAATVKRSD